MAALFQLHILIVSIKTSRFAQWLKACTVHAESINTFQEPLPHNEVKATVKSVATWTWRNFDVAASDARFSALQAHRGKKGNKASIASRQMQLIDFQGVILQ